MERAEKKAQDEVLTGVPGDAQVATLYPDGSGDLTLSYGKLHTNWLTFAKTYMGSHALESDAVYALPDLLISAIVKQIPDFFSEEEQHFERDLAPFRSRVFLKRPFAYPRLPDAILSGQEASRKNKFDQRQVASAQKLRTMLEDEMRSSGRTEAEIRRYRAAQYAEQGNVEIRQRGYASWLVINGEFRRDRDAFRTRWESTIKELGGFPTFPQSLMGEKPSPPRAKYREFYDDYKNLCVTWGLDGFATWDLPKPMRPELGRPSLHYLPAVGEAGITLFVPWYLLRDKDIRLDELAERSRTLKGPEHLKDWLDHKPTGWGYDRYAVMLEINIYIELCVKSRYAGRLKRNVERLDRALGYFLCSGPDKELGAEQEAETIRKIRQAMNRWLKVCAVPAKDG